MFGFLSKDYGLMSKQVLTLLTTVTLITGGTFVLYRDEEETIVMITTSLDGTFRVVCSADTGLPTKENRINIACLLTVVVIHG